MLIQSPSTLDSRSVSVVRLRRLVVELSVWLSQPHGQLQGRLYLPRLFVYYHYFAACLSYPAARRQ